MRDLKPLPATASKARRSDIQNSARAAVILTFIASVTFHTLEKTLAVLIAGWWILEHVCLPTMKVPACACFEYERLLTGWCQAHLLVCREVADEAERQPNAGLALDVVTNDVVTTLPGSLESCTVF